MSESTVSCVRVRQNVKTNMVAVSVKPDFWLLLNELGQFAGYCTYSDVVDWSVLLSDIDLRLPPEIVDPVQDVLVWELLLDGSSQSDPRATLVCRSVSAVRRVLGELKILMDDRLEFCLLNDLTEFPVSSSRPEILLSMDLMTYNKFPTEVDIIIKTGRVLGVFVNGARHWRSV